MLRLMLRSPSRCPLRRTHQHVLTRSSRSQHFHKDYNAAKEDQSIGLFDGRIMGFAEYGTLDGSGVPMFLFHGCPGSRYDGAALLRAAEKLKIHIVCPDRPGYGLSTIQPGRKLSDYPNDIRQLANNLEFSKYHILGISGGGPYAIACARFLPKDELLSTSVIAGSGPPDTLTLEEIGWWGLSMSYLARYAPTLLSWFMDLANKQDPTFQKAATHGIDRLSEDDQAELSDPSVQATNMATFQAAYSQGSAGVIQDIQTFDNAWDFKLEDIESKVKLFYGTKDVHTPLSLGQYYQSRLPNAELLPLRDASHITILKRNEEILRNVLDLRNA